MISANVTSESPMKILIVSSSFDANSRSQEIARRCVDLLSSRSTVTFVRLEEYPLHGKDLHFPQLSPVYHQLHSMVLESDGLVLASPVYNWSCCAELKRFVEVIGLTPPDRSRRSAFFDKVITFVNAAGLPHSYMAFTDLANAMMLDFKCIVSPYNIYVHDRDWNGYELADRVTQRLIKSMDVFLELVTLLKARTYKSDWEI